MTVTGANNYTWQPGNLTGSVVNVSPIAPTVFTVTGDNGACFGTQTVSIGIFPLPVVSSTASSTQICAGDQVTLLTEHAMPIEDLEPLRAERAVDQYLRQSLSEEAIVARDRAMERARVQRRLAGKAGG